ncbi:multicopper oxidase domain-containing protein [Candidatus Woesearchaeota archaeon]|nr:multicopper oxidase domain-containing protein [Candidatus Woesearchaeota archaeon]
MKQIFVILAIVILSLFIIGCNETVEELPVKPEGTPEPAAEEPIEEPVTETAPIELKVIKVTGENYKFMMDGKENPEIKVKVGQKIKIEFTSTEGFHDFVIDELEAKTDKVNSGGSTSVEFVANQAGTFSYYCSVGKHRDFGMEGTFIVE